MSAIEDDFQTGQVELPRKGVLQKNDVTPDRVFDTKGFADLFGGGPQGVELFRKDQIFDLLILFEDQAGSALNPRRFHAVVFKIECCPFFWSSRGYPHRGS